MSCAVWHRAFVRVGVPVGAALLLVGLAATSASAFTMERVSIASDGTEGDMSSTTSAISADGRFVAFVSGATNLVPDDTNFTLDVFVHDRVLGLTERASVSELGEEGFGQAATPALSADGRYLVFASNSPNLVPGDTNNRFDVFLRDRVAGTLELVSVATDGTQGNLDSIAPAISADGRYVAFASAATNLVADDVNNSFDIFVRDRLAQTTTLVSVASDGTRGNGLSLAPRISADGSVVVFHSFASNLVPDDTNGVPDVFAHDVASGITTRVSVASDGTQGNQQSVGAMVSGDGRFVAFDSDASNLVSNDLNGRTDVFVHDRLSGGTERVSVASDGTEANDRSGFVDPPALSFDGRFAAFTSSANNLVENDTNNVVDVFLRDRATGTTIRVDVTPDGGEADGAASLWPSLSADGRVVVFASMATNLVPDDMNFVQDVFVYADTCGNGTLEAGEACDDGNLEDGDCCTSSCEIVPEGAACDDGDLCTQTDVCDANGVCVGFDPVVCEDGGSGECGSAGQCDPATGECVGGPVPDGSPCEDGDACTVGDVCVSGVCEPGELEPAACLSAFQCYAGQSWHAAPWWFGPEVEVEDCFETVRLRIGSTASVCTALDPPEEQLAEQMACLRVKLVRSAPGHTHSAYAAAQGSKHAEPHKDKNQKDKNQKDKDKKDMHHGPKHKHHKHKHPRAHGDQLSVLVTNGFGSHALLIGEVERLCLPAGKSEVPTPAGLDAFKCHSAHLAGKKPHFMQQKVQVTDEHGSAKVLVKRPDMLCNPASVNGSEVLHDEAHLVCYRISELKEWGRKGFQPRNVSVAYAGEKAFVALLAREHLCVPSVVEDD